MDVRIKSPYLIAKGLVSKEQFQKICEYSAYYGVLHSDEKFFIAAIPINSKQISNKKLVKRKNRKKLIDNPDTWLILLAAGEVWRAFDCAKKMKYVTYRRSRDRYQIYNIDRLRKRSWQIKAM